MVRDASNNSRLREHRKQRFEPTLARHSGRLVKLPTARWSSFPAPLTPLALPSSSSRPWPMPTVINPISAELAMRSLAPFVSKAHGCDELVRKIIH